RQSDVTLVMPNQIEEREQKNPHDIDEVPVQTGDLHRCVIGCREAIVPGSRRQHGENGDANNHVYGMHAGHGKIKTEKELDLLSVRSWEGKSSPRYQVILELMTVLDHLDAKKD